MFLGLEWYGWLVVVAALIITIPLKIKFMKWWETRQSGFFALLICQNRLGPENRRFHPRSQ